MFWKIIGFLDACFGNFTEILDIVLEFFLEMETLKVGTSPGSLIWNYSAGGGGGGGEVQLLTQVNHNFLVCNIMCIDKSHLSS